MPGFTFIEFLIYIAIVSLVLVLTVGFGIDIFQGSIKNACWREVEQNTRFAMEKIERTVRLASGINSPSLGNSADSLSLAMQDAALNPTLFDVFNGKIKITQGSGSSYYLTSDQVEVSNLLCRNLSYQDTPGTLKIEMTINYKNPSGRSEYSASITESVTVSLVPGGGVPGGWCQGTPTPCLVFVNEGTCKAQDGCSWSPANCGGTCTPCSSLNRPKCSAQDGCTWFLSFCFGTCTSCDTYGNQSDCTAQLGCSWNPASCSGTATPCESYSLEEQCNGQAGCQWVNP